MTVTFVGRASVSSQRRALNAAFNRRNYKPEYRGHGPLAVVGGGPSIRDHADELRAFAGTVWAINGTINWCLDQGIDAWFFTVDAAPIENWTYPLNRVKRAVLSIDCDPSLVAALAQSEVVTLPPPSCGPTSASEASLKAIDAGHDSVVFYGCESSFAVGETHAFASYPISAWVGINVGGKTYVSHPEFIQQAQSISADIREWSHVFSERSGGLLRAMVEHGPDYDLAFLSPGAQKTLVERDKLTPEQIEELGKLFPMAKSRNAVL